VTTGAGPAILRVDSGFYHIGPPGSATQVPIDELLTPENGLVGCNGTNALVLTGTIAGPVAVAGQMLTERPRVRVTDWERIVEVSVHASDRGIAVFNELASTQVVIVPPGYNEWFCVRVHVRGWQDARTATAGGALDEPVEHHLVQAWPEPPSEPLVLLPARPSSGSHPED
jgi:hypothetical protein